MSPPHPVDPIKPPPPQGIPALDTLVGALRARHASAGAHDALPPAFAKALDAYREARRVASIAPVLAALGFPVPSPALYALELLDAVNDLPELRATAPATEDDDPDVAAETPDAPPETPYVCAYPRLLEAARTRTLWLFGGRGDERQQAAFAALLPGAAIEWADTQDGRGAKSASRVVGSITASTTAAVIIFTGMTGHTDSNRVVVACRAGVVPFTQTRLPGQRRNVAALADLEAQLTPRP